MNEVLWLVVLWLPSLCCWDEGLEEKQWDGMGCVEEKRGRKEGQGWRRNSRIGWLGESMKEERMGRGGGRKEGRTRVEKKQQDRMGGAGDVISVLRELGQWGKPAGEEERRSAGLSGESRSCPPSNHVPTTTQPSQHHNTTQPSQHHNTTQSTPLHNPMEEEEMGVVVVVVELQVEVDCVEGKRSKWKSGGGRQEDGGKRWRIELEQSKGEDKEGGRIEEKGD
ncbi:hypothetical protein Pmani_002639 [Petrolisthes manimaculis]|uniref:Uncharacterized protein n=1 Tax=Petrolisthes manimaculis TaxID=1843537 RepID=A0AAE1UQT6_9EUCA|nr:hypothetical protein Pmani_002639 [Petrolisthes manimaculis]